MGDLFLAEWKKVSGNRWLTGCTVWIFPFLAFLLMGLLVLIKVFSPSTDSEVFNWMDLPAVIWAIQSNIISRPFLLAFAAAIFASEYENKTWKNVIPGNFRMLLIFNKYLALMAFIMLGFLAMFIILFAGGGVLSILDGTSYGEAFNGSNLAEFAGDLAIYTALSLVNILILTGIAALIAIVARSVLFGVIAGIVFAVVELLITFLLLLAADLIWEGFEKLYLGTLVYNSNNIINWLENNDPAISELSGDYLSLETSILVLVAWMIVLIGSTTFIFQRQDIQ